ncbi:hypothetical protein NDU88_005536 [Pleurodeles waltl]|uniref:Uncharacterized protein n=1 Tax=Pleurodeles waltl TaxID=8319 RepID=A0AAV7LLR3_PLEWA|nr:hypothetical protein NDU88_005536 [Pleurodeles waltl]
MSPIASGDRGGVEQDKEPSQQQAAPAEVPETGTTRMRETVLTRSRTKESHVARGQLRRSCNAGRLANPITQDNGDFKRQQLINSTSVAILKVRKLQKQTHNLLSIREIKKKAEAEARTCCCGPFETHS